MRTLVPVFAALMSMRSGRESPTPAARGLIEIESRRSCGIAGRRVEIEDQRRLLLCRVRREVLGEREHQLRHQDLGLGAVDHVSRVGEGVLIHEERDLALADLVLVAGVVRDPRPHRVDHVDLDVVQEQDVGVRHVVIIGVRDDADLAADVVFHDDAERPADLAPR